MGLVSDSGNLRSVWLVWSVSFRGGTPIERNSAAVVRHDGDTLGGRVRWKFGRVDDGKKSLLDIIAVHSRFYGSARTVLGN